MLLPGAQARVADPRDAPAEARRAAFVLARDIWGATPDPRHGWRARSLRKLGYPELAELLPLKRPLATCSAAMDQYNLFNELRLAARPGAAVPLPEAALGAGDDAAWAAFAAGFVQFAETQAPGEWRAAGAAVAARQGPRVSLRQLAARAPTAPEGWRAMDDAGRPLLNLASGTASSLDLLRHAMQPLWERALAAR